jgi:hypothetical protein
MLRSLLVLSVLVGLWSGVVIGQDAEVTPEPANPVETLINALFSADNVTPLIGEPVQLEFVVEVPPGVEIVEWPEFPEDWPPFMVREVGPVEIDEQADDGQIWRQALTVILWRTGDRRTPDVFIGYRSDALDEDEIYRIPARPLFFTVPSVLETTDLNVLDIRPARNPLGLFYLPPWVVVLVIVSVAGKGWYLWRWRERRRALAAARQAMAEQPTAGEMAMESLAELSLDTPDQVYEQVADVLREYLWARFDIPASDMTTVEIRAALDRQPDLEPEQIGEAVRLLEQADLVKFAEAAPGERSAQRAVAAAARWLQAVDPGLLVSAEDIA